MALKILYTHVRGTLTADISAATTLIPVDSQTLATLTAQVNFAGGDWTYLTFDNGIYSEEMKVTALSTTNLVVTRAASGSTAMIFSATNTTIRDHVGQDGIKDIINANPSPSAVTVGAAGIAGVTQPTNGNYILTVQPPVFTGTDGIAVTGIYPNFAIAYEGMGGGCGCGGGSSGGSGTGVSQLVVNSTILSGSIAGDILTLGLPAPSFTGAGGIAVSGNWANGFVITGGGGGGTGTVQSVSVGAGLSIAGTPTVNPTISLSNTGVSAGTYGGITVNAQGQIVSFTSGYTTVSGITLTNGGTVTNVGGAESITLNVAEVGQQGIVALADSGSPFNASEDTLAVTSKVVAQAISALSASMSGNTQTSGESAASYTATIASTAMSLTLLSSQQALIIGEVDVINTAGPGTVPQYGVAVLTTDGTVLFSSRIAAQGKQFIACFISGQNIAGKTIGIATTALASGNSVVTATLAVIIT